MKRFGDRKVWARMRAEKVRGIDKRTASLWSSSCRGWRPSYLRSSNPNRCYTLRRYLRLRLMGRFQTIRRCCWLCTRRCSGRILWRSGAGDGGQDGRVVHGTRCTIEGTNLWELSNGSRRFEDWRLVGWHRLFERLHRVHDSRSRSRLVL